MSNFTTVQLQVFLSMLRFFAGLHYKDFRLLQKGALRVQP